MIHQNGFRRTASPPPSQWFEEEGFGEINRESPNYVGWLQTSLNRALVDLRTPVDGRIGPQTRSALRSFQRRAGLTPNGRSDLLTERELSSAGAGPPPGARLRRRPTAGKLRRSLIRLPQCQHGKYAALAQSFI